MEKDNLNANITNDSNIYRDDRDILEFWTVQSPIVLDTVEKDEIYYVKKRYVSEKYGDTAWIFRTAYDYLSKEMNKIIPKPTEAEYPVWIYKDPKRVFKSSGSYLLKLKIPKSLVVCFDHRDWTKVLNLSLIGSEEEVSEFENEMMIQGIKIPSDVFEKPFYPLLKNKVIKSWDKLLHKNIIEDMYCQGATWSLKKEWIVKRIPIE